MAKKPKTLKVAEMTVADVLKLPLFFDNVTAEIIKVTNQRESARKEHGRLKAHPIDDLNKEGYLEPGNFIVAYGTIIDKKMVGMSSGKRDFILYLGTEAFNKTIITLLQNEAKDEKKRDRRNGQSK